MKKAISPEIGQGLKILRLVYEQMVNVERVNGGTTERLIAELIRLAFGDEVDSLVSMEAANDRLREYGIKVEMGKPYWLLATNSTSVARLLKPTRLRHLTYHKSLVKVPGVEIVPKTIYFSQFLRSRAVKIPTNVFMRYEKDFNELDMDEIGLENQETVKDALLGQIADFETQLERMRKVILNNL